MPHVVVFVGITGSAKKQWLMEKVKSMMVEDEEYGDGAYLHGDEYDRGPGEVTHVVTGFTSVAAVMKFLRAHPGKSAGGAGGAGGGGSRRAGDAALAALSARDGARDSSRDGASAAAAGAAARSGSVVCVSTDWVKGSDDAERLLEGIDAARFEVAAADPVDQGRGQGAGGRARKRQRPGSPAQMGKLEAVLCCEYPETPRVNQQLIATLRKMCKYRQNMMGNDRSHNPDMNQVANGVNSWQLTMRRAIAALQGLVREELPRTAGGLEAYFEARRGNPIPFIGESYERLFTEILVEGEGKTCEELRKFESNDSDTFFQSSSTRETRMWDSVRKVSRANVEEFPKRPAFLGKSCVAFRKVWGLGDFHMRRMLVCSGKDRSGTVRHHPPLRSLEDLRELDLSLSSNESSNEPQCERGCQLSKLQRMGLAQAMHPTPVQKADVDDIAQIIKDTLGRMFPRAEGGAEGGAGNDWEVVPVGGSMRAQASHDADYLVTRPGLETREFMNITVASSSSASSSSASSSSSSSSSSHPAPPPVSPICTEQVLHELLEQLQEDGYILDRNVDERHACMFMPSPLSRWGTGTNTMYELLRQTAQTVETATHGPSNTMGLEDKLFCVWDLDGKAKADAFKAVAAERGGKWRQWQQRSSRGGGGAGAGGGAGGGGRHAHSKLLRVDIVVVPFYQKGFSMIGWTGSVMFNRFLRDFARKELKEAHVVVPGMQAGEGGGGGESGGGGGDEGGGGRGGSSTSSASVCVPSRKGESKASGTDGEDHGEEGEGGRHTRRTGRVEVAENPDTAKFCMTNQGLVNVSAAKALWDEILSEGQDTRYWSEGGRPMELARRVLVGGYPERPIAKEEDVFRMCGLPFTQPQMRNCAV